MDSFLFQATIYLAAAVVAVPLSARLGLGSVLGYLAAGIIIGQVPGIGADAQDLQHFAEFGVVMMLFLIGLDLEPKALWAMRHRLIGLGGLQIVITTLLIMALAMALGLTAESALAVGLILSLSSTAIVLQTLSEKHLMQTSGGRSAFSVLLTQDIAVIPMLALLPLLALGAPVTLFPDGSMNLGGTDAATAGHGPSLVEGLPGWGVTLVTLAMVAAIILAGIYLTRPLFRFIQASRLREMYTALALLIVIGIAFGMTLVGLSPALGAFLAGVVLANSEFRHQLESDLEPFKGLLLGLFFITVGAGIDISAFLQRPANIIGLALTLIALKGAVLYTIGRAFGLRQRELWLFTLSLAQAGEFGFVLISFSLQQSVLPPPIAEKLHLVIAMSMLATPLLFILHELLARRLSDHSDHLPPDEIDEQGPVIIAGIGRFGQIVNRLVQSAGFRTVVLDHDIETIRLMRRFGFKGFFGDPTRPELLQAAGLSEASVFVVALDDPKAALKIVTYVRKQRPDIFIIARAQDRPQVFRLHRAGADKIVREMFDSSLRAGRYALEQIGLSEYEAAEAQQAFYTHDRKALRELADLWDPTIPAGHNKAYIDRARELQNELETSLLARLDQTHGSDEG
ncbi:monovalent cation:proton antiporter-2 (CPA2) family protein [Aquicoccus sp. G2-2]|uniref:monovalent cation:proton antiporter-2 (CPA2) family protein n=1 Tax=Aquicoccus sp. G2-2 TaxID=3092120 RepID=UPI002ADFFDAF|nr:monovalent cation:proton antiporter-2 (CPA2) family protein [Aquicoccus sp. G2-2]MEA1112612.1 monovalent cation:proton antiporter-2 (CPA2) family protein [Aquicoccus sp. G2-2]